jgi:hypothetical protein
MQVPWDAAASVCQEILQVVSLVTTIYAVPE